MLSIDDKNKKGFCKTAGILSSIHIPDITLARVQFDPFVDISAGNRAIVQ